MKAPDGRPTIVFLHEGLGSIALWRDFPRRLAEAADAGALVYSRYGNGHSSALEAKRSVAYMHDEATRMLPEILRLLEIDRPVLFGHSDGASIALIYAGAVRSGARGLVLEAPHLFVEDLSVASIAATRERYEGGGLRAKMLRYHRDVDATFYGWNDIWLDAAFRSWNVEEPVRNVTAPVLALQGTGDEYGTLAQLAALRAQSAGSVDTVVLSNCGHAPHRDRPGFVEKAVSSWIAELASR